MPYFTVSCGCELDAYVSVDYDCGCCGTDYSINDAYFVNTCETHKPVDKSDEA